jgi:hypothetical protein
MKLRRGEMKGGYIPYKTFILVFLFCFIVTGDYLYAEKIKIKIEDGVTVVYNPKNPAPSPDTPAKLVLKEDLTIGEKEGEEEYMFVRIVGLDVDDGGSIYVLDQRDCNIKVFNNTGKLIRTIGKKGQGPGEMQAPRDIQITPQNEIMVNDSRSRRLLFFSLDGKFLRKVSQKEMTFFSHPKCDTKSNIVASFMVVGEKAVSELKKFTPELDPIFNISSVEILRFPVFDPFFPQFYWQITGEDNIIWGFPVKYEIQVLNPEGKIIRKIIKDYNPVKITKEEKENIVKELYPGTKVEFKKHHLAFMYLMLDEQGRIFVRTYEKVNDGEGFYYDVFDSEGRYIAKIPLKMRPRDWKKNKLYTIEEDREGYRYVKRYSVEWK